MIFNILTAKGGGTKFISPFRLTILPDTDNESSETDKITYKTYLNWHSSLYDTITSTQTLSKKYSNFNKITIQGLNFSESIGEDLYEHKYIYCILKITIKDFSVETAEIVYENQSTPEKIVPIVFENEENLKQIEARVVLAAIAFDDKAISETEFAFDPETNSRNISPSVYVIQYVNTNLIMTNMVFNGVPVLYPAPFGGCLTSDDGSDREI